MPDDAQHAMNTELDRLARDAIETLRLPLQLPTALFGGPGSTERCAVCREMIPTGTLEMELAYGLNGSAVSYHLHIKCFNAWEIARNEVERRAVALDSRNLPPSDGDTKIAGRAIETKERPR